MKRIVLSLVCVMLSTLIYGQSFDDVLKAAKGGDAAAQLKLGSMYATGDGVSQDVIQSIIWLQKAADQGVADAATACGFVYLKGELPFPKEHKEEQALKWFMKGRDLGSVFACYCLGMMYLNGQGTSVNLQESLNNFRIAAENGHGDAMVMTASAYLDGRGTLINEGEAFKWYLKAAQLGIVDAQSQVGYMYSRGIGITANKTEGFKWTKLAAEAGDAIAQANLSWYYLKGLGTNIDYEEAYKWAMLSANQNESLGYENLANCYLVGARKDVNKAIECINKSIELCKSSGRSQYDKTYLLRLYNQKGVIYLDEKNFVKAKEMAQLIMDINPQYQDEEDNRLMLYAQTGEISSKDTNVAQIKRVTPSSDVDIEIPQLSQINETTFAVIIANENYEEETQVEYALNDGEIFKTYCKEVLGLPESNIHYRENATLNNILAELDWMKKISTAFGEEAKFIFYYAGHGIPDEASGDAYLLPVDGRGNILATGYSLNKLYETLGGLTAKSVTVFMDACFSGAVRDGGMMASARGVAIKAKQAAPKGNMIVLSAAQGDETAYPYKEKGHGLFTYYLLKKLQETKGDVTLGELSDYITSEVKKRSIIANGKLQTPIVTSSNSAADWRSWTLK